MILLENQLDMVKIFASHINEFPIKLTKLISILDKFPEYLDTVNKIRLYDIGQKIENAADSNNPNEQINYTSNPDESNQHGIKIKNASDPDTSNKRCVIS